MKGLYRRGMAYIAGGEYDDARNDFNMVYYAKTAYHNPIHRFCNLLTNMTYVSVF